PCARWSRGKSALTQSVALTSVHSFRLTFRRFRISPVQLLFSWRARTHGQPNSFCTHRFASCDSSSELLSRRGAKGLPRKKGYRANGATAPQAANARAIGERGSHLQRHEVSSRGTFPRRTFADRLRHPWRSDHLLFRRHRRRSF